MAMTEDVLVDRIRALLIGLTFSEAVGSDFTKTPMTSIDKAFAVAFVGAAPIGGMGFHEEGRGRLVIDLARLTRDNTPQCKNRLYQDLRDVITAIVQDGAVTSGEYAVETADRTFEILAPSGAAYLAARLTMPVNFEAVLS